ncbi:hypothetical protein A7D25_01500 [Pseudomonas sp. 21C1]|uniref:hypothetical protein n=1 Tax=Pseudomonas TaxID=286 RepID=UPI00084B1848|nr:MULTISPECIES: hypothetical protein [Pseudomonas]OEC37365.1 hypothetical protein A7D25_01500 [Pseudomonas sp. 21C1]
MDVTPNQLFAFAIYEIRQLLAHHLGSDDNSDPAVKAAAHLAYALHNQADVILQDRTFDPQQAIESLNAIDRMLATNFQARFLQSVSHDA